MGFFFSLLVCLNTGKIFLIFLNLFKYLLFFSVMFTSFATTYASLSPHLTFCHFYLPFSLFSIFSCFPSSTNKGKMTNLINHTERCFFSMLYLLLPLLIFPFSTQFSKAVVKLIDPNVCPIDSIQKQPMASVHGWNLPGCYSESVVGPLHSQLSE